MKIELSDFLRRRTMRSGVVTIMVAIGGWLLCATASAQIPQPSTAKKDFVLHCADCHGITGVGNGPATEVIPGFKPTNLTLLSKNNGGQFPRQEVYEVIDGRKRFAGHFDPDTDMPLWGLTFQPEGREFSKEAEAKVKARIDGLVNYIEGIQQK
jgi:mono/diheme cytochrome c family protein